MALPMRVRMKTLHVTERSEWRAWLQANGGKEKEIWLVFYKKHTGKARLTYDDAVEEALCSGWIDSTVRRLDEERYAQKFTPRNRNSKWSDLNIERAKKMIITGRMTPAGRAVIEPAILSRKPAPKAPRANDVTIPPYILAGLAADGKARTYFDSLASSYRRLYVRWVASAKNEETRKRRLVEMLATLRAGRKLGMK
jgi:uncharacterized protein YdeI (YjbR/CyaY-like superfamily)